MRRRQIWTQQRIEAAVQAIDVPEVVEKTPRRMFACECGREFAYQGSLNFHKLNCRMTREIAARLEMEYGGDHGGYAC